MEGLAGEIQPSGKTTIRVIALNLFSKNIITKIPILLIITAFVLLVPGVSFPSDTQAPDIISAARNGNIAQVKKILTKNPELVNKKDSSQCTPLHWAAFMGYYKTAKLLIENGADLKAKDKLNSTPLHIAVIKRHQRLARLLVDSGAPINAKGYEDLTALHLAAYRGLRPLIKYLVSKGADLNAKESRGWTPLKVAEKFGNKKTVELLKKIEQKNKLSN